MAKKIEDGKKVRQSSFEGLVLKKRLKKSKERRGSEVVSDSASDHSILPPKRKKGEKNHFAKEVAGVVEGLHEKAADLRKRIEERDEREQANIQVQQDLGRRMDLLIESNQRKNESIQMLLHSLISSRQ